MLTSHVVVMSAWGASNEACGQIDTVQENLFDTNVVPIKLPVKTNGIKVAILAAWSGNFQNEDNACVSMANILINHGINAVIVRSTDIDTLEELLEYDVVILGTCGLSIDDMNSGFGDVQDEIRAFVEIHGRGCVGSGLNYTVANNNWTDYDAIFPVDLLTPYSFLWGFNVVITNPDHPVVDDVNDFAFDSSCLAEWCPGGIKPNADVLGEYTQNSKEAIVSWTLGAKDNGGRVIYLGPYYLTSENVYNTEAYYQDPDTIKLLVNAVNWAAGEEPQPQLAIDIILNANAFGPGDTLDADARVTNGDEAVTVDIKTWLKAENSNTGDLIVLMTLLNFNAVTLPANFDSGDVNIFDFIFPTSPPMPDPMDIEICGRILDTITGDHLDTDCESCTYTP
jgi:hypothetical protein